MLRTHFGFYTFLCLTHKLMFPPLILFQIPVACTENFIPLQITVSRVEYNKIMKERVLATIEIETRVSLTSVDGMEAGHEGGPARRADGVDVVVVEDDARVGQGVDVGRWDLV